MKPSESLERHRADIRRIVEANRACNPRVFGSVLRGEDEEGSDLDILVDALETTSLFDLSRMELRLQDLLQVRVDVRTPLDLHERFRDSAVAEAVPV